MKTRNEHLVRNRSLCLLSVQDDSIVLGLEPLHGLVLDQTVGESDGSNLSSPVSHVHTGASQDDVEVHTVDTNGRIVLDAQVDVLLDTESKVSVVRKVFAAQLVLANLRVKEHFKQMSCTFKQSYPTINTSNKIIPV